MLSLIFSLHTHKHLFQGSHEHEPEEETPWSLRSALATLAISTAFIAWLSEILVGSVEEAAAQIGMSKIFVGVIIVAVIGNAAEHSTAVIAAMRNRMDLSLGIAMGSSTQVALFVAPPLVFLSYATGAAPMVLAFTIGDTFAIHDRSGDNGTRDKRWALQLVQRSPAVEPLSNLGCGLFHAPA